MVDNPQTLQALRQRISSLSPAQQQLFRQQLRARGIAWDQDSEFGSQKNKKKASDAVITHPPKLPLSASQKHLWVLHQLYPNTTAYYIGLALSIKGKLNVSAMQQSFQSIVDRHESLRSIFLEGDRQPYVQVLPTVALDLPVIDLRSAENGAAAVTHWQKKLSQMPFDLEQGPLIRAQLLQLEDNRFDLILILHHLIADGWSRGILLKELSLNYQRYAQGYKDKKTILSELKSQYSDYSIQQQQWLKSDKCERQRAYWKQQLADLPELNLPVDGSASTDFTSQTCTLSFSAEQTQRIKGLAKRSGATIFMALLAIFNLLLHRYSRQRDLAVGVPVAGRNTPAVESLIGFFVNTLVLRSHINPRQHFTDWLQQIQATLADALQHQDIPFSEVVEAVGTTRVPGKNPLFRVMFQVQSDGYQPQNAQQLGLALPGLTLTQRWIEPSETKFDMSWHVIERDSKLLVAVEYRTGLFERERVERMLGHFHTLTDNVVAEPQKKLYQFSLLSAQEQEQILNKWSQGKTVEPPTVCFPARFEQQVEQTPDAIAVTDHAHSESAKTTYRQLNQRANKLAHWLRAQAVGPNVLVGICAGSGIDLMVALLATLKAGGTYIPLDPALPFERLQYMVKDAKPAVLIGYSNGLASRLTEDSFTVLFCVDKNEQQLISQPDHNLAAIATLTDIAYVIYTSGSTGKPKGTQLTHGGLVNYLDWCLKAYPVGEGCGAPVQSSIGFDATITSLFSPLLAGKQVALNFRNVNSTNSKNNREIEVILAALSGGFSFIKLTPAYLSALQPLVKTQQIDQNRLPKAFIIGGEALQEQHISFWRKHYPEIVLINEYGPTEAVVGCCVHWVTEKDSGNIPIGRPIDGTQLYILDEYQQPVPIGVPGELYIGGTGVARGYLNQPSLTAERFVSPPAPLPSPPHSFLYKTGDLVAYQSNGTLKYLGRIDDQIKLRGFRIEPGEIEAALCQGEQVEQAFVMLREDHNKRELVAYIATTTGKEEKEEKDVAQLSQRLQRKLRQRLERSLPSYMVPAHFVVLEALPFTSNGKIDRRALPAPSVEIVATQKDQPRDHKEGILTEIWKRILNRSEIGIYDNFFELGGDSISGMQIVSKAHQQGLHLTPTQLFQYQTIAEQAAVATEQSLQSFTEAFTTPALGSVPLSPIQQNFFEQALPNPDHFNQAVMLTVQPDIKFSALKAALNKLAQHHDGLRLRFEQTKSGWEQHYIVPEGDSVPLDEIDLTHQGSPTLEDVMASFQASLDLFDGPLFRGVLVTLNSTLASNKRLLLIAHHLIVDSVSWRILLADLAMSYEQSTAAQEMVLPAKTTAFGHWTAHLKEAAQNRTFEAEYDYWTDSCCPTAPLPVDEPLGQNTVADMHEALINLDVEEIASLIVFQQPVDVLLLTALAQTIKQWSRSNTITLDMEAHGRRVWDNTLDLSRTVGWFTALYPLKLFLPSGTLSEQLNRVKEQLHKVPNGGVGYGALKSQLKQAQGATIATRDSEVLNSPAQISFNYLGRLNIEKSGITIRGLAPESVTNLRNPAGERRYLLEIVALIQSEQLQVRWRYSRKQYRQSTIEQLSQRFHTNLSSLLAGGNQTQDNQDSCVTPANFVAARVEADQLNKLMSKLKARGGKS